MSAFPSGSSSDEEPFTVADLAMQWAARQDGGLDATERLAFAQWLADSALHRDEYTRALASWRQSNQVAGFTPSEAGALRQKTRRIHVRMTAAILLSLLVAATLAVLAKSFYR